jgi:hypothetical protein
MRSKKVGTSFGAEEGTKLQLEVETEISTYRSRISISRLHTQQINFCASYKVLGRESTYDRGRKFKSRDPRFHESKC